MAKKKIRHEPEFVFFDVLYEDGTRRSNRRVASSELEDQEDGDSAAKYILEAQDRELGALAGQPRPGIKSVSRSPAR